MKNILREILNCESYCEMYHIETMMSYEIKKIMFCQKEMNG